MINRLIINYSELLDSLNLSRKTIAEHSRFISTLCHLSMRKQLPTNTQIIKTIKQFSLSHNSDIQKNSKQTLKSWKRVQGWQKRYKKNPQALFKHVLQENPVFPFNVNYTPLGIILTLHEADYFSALEDSSSNATTIFDFAVPIIVLHQGGYIADRIPPKQLRNTLQHELHHAIFDMYYDASDKPLSLIENTIKISGKKMDYHRVYASDLALVNSETSRSEFFAYASNMETNVWLSGLLQYAWSTRLHRINAVLLEQPRITNQQRRAIYTLYKEYYNQYLKDLDTYQRLILWLFTQQTSTHISHANIMAILALTPFSKIQSLRLPNYHTSLQKEIRDLKKNSNMEFQAKLTLHRSKRFMAKHDQPTPHQLLSFVKTLSKYDPEEWTFLRKYIIKKSLVNPDGLALMKYCIEFCPDDPASSTVCVVLRIIMEDNTLTSRQHTSLKHFLERMLKILPERRPVYISIYNLLEDLQHKS